MEKLSPTIQELLKENQSLKLRIIKLEQLETEHERVEKALQQSEIKLRTIFENSVDAIGVSQEGIQTFMNRAYLSLFGYSSIDELIDQPVLMLIAPSEHEKILRRIKSHAKGEVYSSQYETRGLRKDGTEFAMDVHVSTYELTGVTYSLVILRDVTEHKRVEEGVHQLLHMLESVPSGVVVHDVKGTFLYANQRAFDMHGYSPDEFMALNLHLITVPASEMLVESRVKEISERGEISFEVEHFKKDGTILPLWINAKNVIWEGKKVMLSVQTDLTERKRAEEEIARMAQILDIAPNSITVHDFDGRFLYANQRTFDLHGYKRDEFLALNLHELDVPESESRIAINIQELLNCGEAIFEVSHFRKDGTTLPLEVSAKIILWGNKKVIISIATDITERKRIEEELLRARKLDSLSVLAGGIAHDFNNLMAIVQGYIDLALSEFPPDHVSCQHLFEAKKSVKSTKDLTRRLMTFSRGEGPYRENLNAAEIIRDSINRIVKGTNIQVKSEFAKNLRHAELDELQIKQCFSNLILNAVEAMPQGGTLSIQAENTEISAGEILDLKEGPYIKITFTDEGVGIPGEHLSKVFDPYFTTKKMGIQKGMGLGLSVCYAVLKSHDGHITVNSQPWQGTSFALYLPALP